MPITNILHSSHSPSILGPWKKKILESTCLYFFNGIFYIGHASAALQKIYSGFYIERAAVSRLHLVVTFLCVLQYVFVKITEQKNIFSDCFCRYSFSSQWFSQGYKWVTSGFLKDIFSSTAWNGTHASVLYWLKQTATWPKLRQVKLQSNILLFYFVGEKYLVLEYSVCMHTHMLNIY